MLCVSVAASKPEGQFRSGHRHLTKFESLRKERKSNLFDFPNQRIDGMPVPLTQAVDIIEFNSIIWRSFAGGVSPVPSQISLTGE